MILIVFVAAICNCPKDSTIRQKCQTFSHEKKENSKKLIKLKKLWKWRHVLC